MVQCLIALTVLPEGRGSIPITHTADHDVFNSSYSRPDSHDKTPMHIKKVAILLYFPQIILF